MADLLYPILILTALFNALGAILAWGAKLWWGREFGAAKDETIRAKEAQIEHLNLQIEQLNATHNEVMKAKEAHLELLTVEIKHLRDLTPMKLREYFVSVKQQLEEYNDKLKNELDENARKMTELEAGGQLKIVEIQQLQEEKVELEYRIDALERLKAKGQLREVTMEDVEKDPAVFVEYLRTLPMDDLIDLRRAASDIYESTERIGKRAKAELQKRGLTPKED